MIRVTIYGLLIVLFLGRTNSVEAQQTGVSGRNLLPKKQVVIPFDGHRGQVEVGGPYAGAEFHESRPLPARISFYYPVANSIDLSSDYWKRGDSRPFALGIRIGDAPPRWLGRESWSYRLSPHRVTFEKNEPGAGFRIDWDFCLNEPALVQRITVKNTGSATVPVELYAHVRAAIRTCQTYTRKDSADVMCDPAAGRFEAVYPGADAGGAGVFILDVGQHPEGYCRETGGLAISDSGTSDWIEHGTISVTSSRFQSGSVPAIDAVVYRANVRPGDSLAVIRVIGSCRKDELGQVTARPARTWEREIKAYGEFVQNYARQKAYLWTRDSILNRSDTWSRGMLAANQHYLDGAIVPMPCPAEYNFYFTHDLLLTDLGAINFDAARVKRDLLYVIRHAKDNIIPHAYYWRDREFQTEYCDSANWNHLWFIIASARYLRHTGDDSTARALYPCVTASLRLMLTQRHADNLMYAYRPDWWDIGRREGPRSYMTILTIRALRDYLYVSSVLKLNMTALPPYERMADSMEAALPEKLWDDSLRYLINYNEGRKDTHYYMGSLLAPVYGVLDPERSAELLATAERTMLRPPVGMMVAAPADFNTDSVRTFFRFAGNEAGDSYKYINGGIWPHANASYALALIAAGRMNDACRFMKESMSIDGIMNSPNGIPAMYEYRYSDTASPYFGEVDKPSFMWAAGFYLNTLYALCGFRDNEWNCSVDSRRPDSLKRVVGIYTFGKPRKVSIDGVSGRLANADFPRGMGPSLVIPVDLPEKSRLRFRFGSPAGPYLEKINAIVYSVKRGQKTLSMEVSSFEGHATVATIVAPKAPSRVTLNGAGVQDVTARDEPDGMKRIEIRFQGSPTRQEITLHF